MGEKKYLASTKAFPLRLSSNNSALFSRETVGVVVLWLEEYMKGELMAEEKNRPGIRPASRSRRAHDVAV